jgi:hypothetical protein
MVSDISDGNGQEGEHGRDRELQQPSHSSSHTAWYGERHQIRPLTVRSL